MSKISLDEQNNMNKIIDISKLIMNVYQRMFFEEIEMNYDESKYTELLGQLKRLLEEENKLYEQLELNPEKVSRNIEYLNAVEKRHKIKENNVLESIVNIDNKDLYIYRIINRLQKGIFKNDTEWENWLITNKAFHSKQEAKKYIGFRRFDEAIENDFENAFLYYLDEKLKNCSSPKDKNYYGKIKYNLLTMSSIVEHHITNKVDSIYFTYPFVAEYHKISKVNSEELVFLACRDYCAEALSSTLIGDRNIDKDFENEFTTFFMYMKASISLIFPFDDYDFLMDSLCDEIEEINDNTNNSLSITSNLLISQIGNIKDEKPKCKYLHLIPHK